MPPGAVQPSRSESHVVQALIRRITELELNQTLSHEWLKLWERQIGTKLKVIHTNLNDTSKQLRGIFGDLAELREGLEDARNKSDARLAEQVVELEVAGRRSSETMRAFEAQMIQLAADSKHRELRARRQVDTLVFSHRVELLCCMLLSITLSSVVAVFCLARVTRAPRASPQNSRQRGRPITASFSSADGEISESEDDDVFQLPSAARRPLSENDSDRLASAMVGERARSQSDEERRDAREAGRATGRRGRRGSASLPIKPSRFSRSVPMLGSALDQLARISEARYRYPAEASEAS